MNLLDEFNQLKTINEDIELYKGIFWITDMENLYNNELFFHILVASDGTIQNASGLYLNSKGGDNYNHRATWENLESKHTHNKRFDYFPRGRVEIAHGKATIYANPNICTEEILEWIKDKFNLYEHNGITAIRMISDNSEHYKCYLDK